MSSLPSGWALSTIPVLCEVLDSLRVPINSDERNQRLAKCRQEDLVPYFGATGQVGWIDAYLFDEDLVLLGEDGVPFLDQGKPKAYRVSGKSWVNNHAHVLRARKEAIDWRLLTAQLNTVNYTGYVTGSTRLKLTQGAMNKLPLLVPPRAEQKRIADKLDTVLTRVDAVNTRLARVAPILKRFRQSVLASVTSGRLTEDWRNDSHSDAGDIPLNWKRTTLRHCITSMTGGASPSVENYAPAGVLALNKGDIKLYGLLAGKKDQKRVPREFAELHRTKLVQQGDLLVTLRDLSSKADFLGLIAQFMGTEVALPTQGMYALTVAENTVPKFLMYFSNSPIYREVMKREKVGATQVHLRNDQFLDIPIALPPVKEQAEVVRRVETLFAFADRLEARLQTAQTATERLTPALLAKAFRGELVLQDPNDEPASELLKRLAATASSPAPKRGRKNAADAAA